MPPAPRVVEVVPDDTVEVEDPGPMAMIAGELIKRYVLGLRERWVAKSLALRPRDG